MAISYAKGERNSVPYLSIERQLSSCGGIPYILPGDPVIGFTVVIEHIAAQTHQIQQLRKSPIRICDREMVVNSQLVNTIIKRFIIPSCIHEIIRKRITTHRILLLIRRVQYDIMVR